MTLVAGGTQRVNAVQWIAEAWKMVKGDTIMKCFRKAGVLNSDFSSVVQPFSFHADPFADLDDEEADREENKQLSELISHM